MSIKKKKSKNEIKQNIKLVFCTSKNSWIVKYLKEYILELKKKKFKASLIYNHKEIKKNNNLAFFLSYENLVEKKYLSLSHNNLVVHESDLPKNKGWSPITWGVLKGKTQFTASLFEADEKIDSGKIYLKKKFIIGNNLLLNEIKLLQFKVTKYLISNFLKDYPKIILSGKNQSGKSNYLRRRTQRDSKIDINKSIIRQFDHLRSLDKKRYPGWFIIRGRKFKILIDKFL